MLQIVSIVISVSISRLDDKKERSLLKNKEQRVVAEILFKEMASKAGELTLLLCPKCSKAVGEKLEEIKGKMCSC